MSCHHDGLPPPSCSSLSPPPKEQRLRVTTGYYGNCYCWKKKRFDGSRVHDASPSRKTDPHRHHHDLFRLLLRLPRALIPVGVTASCSSSSSSGGSSNNNSSGTGHTESASSTSTQQKQQITNNERVLSSLVAGAMAGAIAKTTIAPLDRTKIFFQTSPETVFNTRQVIRYLYKTYKSTGFTSLWRGNSATMVRIIPYAAIQFTAHEQWKRVLKVDQQSKSTSSTSTSEITRFLCGSLAGVTAQGLTYPLDLSRARLAVSSVSQYVSLTDVIAKTVRHEGVRGLFKGFVPTMLGVIPYAGCSFYCYEGLKRLWVDKFGADSVGGVERLSFGAIAGVVGQSSSYPFDIVRRRLQTNRGNGEAASGGGIQAFRLMRYIAKTEGVISGLYKGLSMNFVKGPVAAGISFACYDFFSQSFLTRIAKEKSRRDGGGSGGAVA